MLIGDSAFTEFKGAYTENFFLQELVGVGNHPAYYYSKDNSRQEIDFLTQHDGKVVPCEVKADENVKSKSLRSFVLNDWQELKLKGLRCSIKPFKVQEWMINIPLYGIEGFFR